MNQLTVTGEITENGDDFGFYNMNQIRDYCRKNPGKKLIVTLQIEEKESIRSMMAYYNAKVVPEWKAEFFSRGILKTRDQVDEHLQDLSPITQKKRLSRLEKDEWVAFLDHIKEVSLSEINLFVEDPRCL